MAPVLAGALACHGPPTTTEPPTAAPADQAAPSGEPVVFVEQPPGPAGSAPAEAPTETPAPAPGPNPDDTDAEAKLRAKQAFSAGTKRFESGDYAGALDDFEQAYADYPMPALQFNIGRCLEKLGRTQEACAAFALVEAKSTDHTRDAARQARAQLGC